MAYVSPFESTPPITHLESPRFPIIISPSPWTRAVIPVLPLSIVSMCCIALTSSLASGNVCLKDSGKSPFL